MRMTAEGQVTVLLSAVEEAKNNVLWYCTVWGEGARRNERHWLPPINSAYLISIALIEDLTLSKSTMTQFTMRYHYVLWLWSCTVL